MILRNFRNKVDSSVKKVHYNRHSNVLHIGPSGKLTVVKCTTQIWHISVTQWQKYSIFLCSTTQEKQVQIKMLDIKVSSVFGRYGILIKGTNKESLVVYVSQNSLGQYRQLYISIELIMDSQSD